MTHFNNKTIALKVARFVFLILCCLYIGYTIGKDAALRDRRNQEKNNIQVDKRNN